MFLAQSEFRLNAPFVIRFAVLEVEQDPHLTWQPDDSRRNPDNWNFCSHDSWPGLPCAYLCEFPGWWRDFDMGNVPHLNTFNSSAPRIDASGVEDITIARGVKQTASQDGLVLLDIEQGICFGLNPVGMKIWEMLKQHASVEQIVDSLEQEFCIPRADLNTDILEFVAQLESKHLIARRNGVPVRRNWLTMLLLRRFGNDRSNRLNGDNKSL